MPIHRCNRWIVMIWDGAVAVVVMSRRRVINWRNHLVFHYPDRMMKSSTKRKHLRLWLTAQSCETSILPMYSIQLCRHIFIQKDLYRMWLSVTAKAVRLKSIVVTGKVTARKWLQLGYYWWIMGHEIPHRMNDCMNWQNCININSLPLYHRQRIKMYVSWSRRHIWKLHYPALKMAYRH